MLLADIQILLCEKFKSKSLKSKRPVIQFNSAKMIWVRAHFLLSAFHAAFARCISCLKQCLFLDLLARDWFRFYPWRKCVQQQKCNVSVTTLRDQFLLYMMITDKNNYTLFCKRAFSDVLEGVASKVFLGVSPQASIFQQHTYQKRLS